MHVDENMKFLSLFLMFILVSSVTFTHFASGYEKENHYWLKMALALNCGFTIDEARLISIGDFSIDEDPDTQPVRSGSDESNPKWKWHALPTENPDVGKNEVSSGNQQIKQRQHELYDRAMNEKNTPMKLFKFGQYLHYQEDKWSHWGYTTGMGHAVPNVVPGITSPDETHANPESYRDMVFDSMVNLGKLAKSLGKDTQCVSDLVPLDTYKSAPEYGKDFPWFSPQEIKRAKDPLKFQKDVNQRLSDWGKSALVEEVITESDNNGDKGVTESFISYIAKKTGLGKSAISEKYDYAHVDIDEDGNAKKLPDNLIKSVTPKEKNVTTKPDTKSKTSSTKDSKKEQKTAKNIDENDKLPKFGQDQIKSLYKIIKLQESTTALLSSVNDQQKTILQKATSSVNDGLTKEQKTTLKALLKEQDSDKKDISAIQNYAKKVSSEVKKLAQTEGIKSSELDKVIKTTKSGKSSKNGPINQLKQDAADAKNNLDEARKLQKENDYALRDAAYHLSDVLDAHPLLTKYHEEGLMFFNPYSIPALLKEHRADLTKDEILALEKRYADQKDFDKRAQEYQDAEKSKQNVIEMLQQALDIVLKEEQSQVSSILDTIPDPTLKDRFVQTTPTQNTQTKPTVKQDSSKPTTKPTTNQATQNVQEKAYDSNVKPESKPTDTKPSLTIPKQVTREATSSSGASVMYDVSGQDKEDGAITPTCDHPPGSTFPIGTSSVTCTVKDSNNNSASGTFTVTVRDTTPPDIPAFQPTEGVRDDTGVQVFFEVTAHDMVDGNVPTSCNYSSGYKFPIGTTVLTCTADDSRGNHASRSLQITVTIKEYGQ